MYQNESGGVVHAWVVTDATEGNVMTVTGSVLALSGDVVVPSQNEAYADVYPGKDFFAVYKEVTQDELDEQESQQDVARGSGVKPGFDPDKETAKSVRDYLSQVRSRDEYDRVAAAERSGRDRATAIPERDADSFDDGE